MDETEAPAEAQLIDAAQKSADAGNAALQRYWDGAAWTAHTAPA